MIRTDDILLKFEYYMCLTKILEKEDPRINYFDLYQNLHRPILESFQTFTNPYIIWALINLLSRMILRVMKFRKNVAFDLSPVFSGIEILAQNDSDIILESLMELLKRMIVSNLDSNGKRETFIYAIKFLDVKLKVFT